MEAVRLEELVLQHENTLYRAALTGEPEGTVRSRLSRARTKLKNMLL